MRLIYRGHRPVDIPAVQLTVEPGVPTEIPDRIAKQLLEQTAMWRKAPTTRKKE